MADERRSKLPSHDSKKVPDASPGCPRCHYWERTEAERLARLGARRMTAGYPNGINQSIAAEILAKAFPQRQRSRE